MKPDQGTTALSRLYTEYAAGLLGFLTYQTGDRSLAEDIVADTFERVLRSRSRWRERSSEKTWLYAIAMNRVRELARRRGVESRALEHVSRGPTPVDEVAAVDDRDLLQRGLNTLSAEERAIIALRYGADLSLREIAEALGERQSTVEARLYRALGRLREAAR